MSLIDSKSETEQVVLHPPDCGCTDCLIGESQPMSEEEFEALGYPRTNIIRMTTTAVSYVSR